MRELTLEAKIDNIPQVTAFIDEQLEALDCPMKAQMQIDVAIDELFCNIAMYAYPDGKGEATVRFEFDESARVATITFVDSGIPFDPVAKAGPGRDALRGGAADRGSGHIHGQKDHGQHGIPS